MQLTIVHHELNIFTIQKMWLSKWSIHCPERSVDFSEWGNFALVPLSDNTFCVCKLFIRREIHPAYVYLDASVVHFKAPEHGLLPKVPLNVNETYVQEDSIKLLPPLSLITNLNVTVIFEEISSLKKWKVENDKLKVMVREILKLFVITENCVVFLKNLNGSLRHGIYALVIHFSSHCGDGIVPGQVTSNTIIETLRIASKLRFQQAQENSVIPKVGGLDNAVATLTDILKSNLLHRNIENTPSFKPTKQVLVTGPPGCGKTSLVKQVVAEANATLLTVLGPELVSSKPGATEEALRKTFENASILAEEDGGAVCVLFLDEVDSLCARRDLHSASTHSVRATVQLLALLEAADKIPGLVIIATTNKPFILDPAVRRPGRLETEVHVGVPTEANRESILHLLLKPMELWDIKNLAKHVASLTPGYVGADLALVCQEVSLIHHRRKSYKNSDVEEGTSLNFWIADFKKSISKIRPSALRSGLGVVLTSPATMDSIGGLENIKKELRVAVEWPLTHPDAFARMGLPQPKGVLLYGPPGCAKTSLARAMATETNTTFLSVSAADLYSPYVGEAERNITELFRRARSGAPTILFIDEIDALVGSRGDSEKGANERVLSTLLTEMDGVGTRVDDTSLSTANKSLMEGDCASEPVANTLHTEKEGKAAGVIVVAATNRPDKLDDALLRPGRIDKLLYVPAPNLKERYEILQHLTVNMPLAQCVNLSYLAEHTRLYSGADLTQLTKEAGLLALTEGGMTTNQIKQSHFNAALKNYHPSLSEQQLSWYENFAGKKASIVE